jgi:hypothetical protein
MGSSKISGPIRGYILTARKIKIRFRPVNQVERGAGLDTGSNHDCLTPLATRA